MESALLAAQSCLKISFFPLHRQNVQFTGTSDQNQTFSHKIQFIGSARILHGRNVEVSLRSDHNILAAVYTAYIVNLLSNSRNV